MKGLDKLMRDEFIRSRMLLGDTAMDALQGASVAVFGIGGVGSYAAEALARSGVGHLALFDADTVALSNINRQLIALHSTVGRPKAEVMAQRIADICPDTRVSVYNVFYTTGNADQYDLSAYTYIVDAIDTVSCKLTLIERAAAAGVPVISSMGAGNKLDPARFQIADISETSVCPLARVMRRELKKRGIHHLKVVYSQEPARTPFPPQEPVADPPPAGPGRARETEDGLSAEPFQAEAPDAAAFGAVRRQTPGSLAFVPSVAGLMLAGEVVRDIAGIN
jgi:tRNA A37 threonylcarbamoyladenosine dehydratase